MAKGNPPEGSIWWWDVCTHGTTCYAANLGGHGDPASPGGFRQDYSVPLPVGTEVVSPVSGVVLPTADLLFKSLFGRQDWGGEVDIATIAPRYDKNRISVVTLLHFDTVDVVPGQWVQFSEHLGTSGGQNDGTGHWPSDSKDSTGPHMGLAVRPAGTWHNFFDPNGMMQDLWTDKDHTTGPTYDELQQAGMLQDTGVNWFGTAGPPKFNFFGLDIKDPLIRFAKIVAGGILILIGLLATIFGPAIPEIAAAGTAAAGYPAAGEVVRASLGGKGRAKIARAAIGGAGSIRGTKVARKQQAKEQVRAEERIATKTAERVKEPLAAETQGGVSRIPPPANKQYYTFAEQRKYFGGVRAGVGQQRPARSKPPAAFGLRGPSAANLSAAQRKREREAREAEIERQRQVGKGYIKGAQGENPNVR